MNNLALARQRPYTRQEMTRLLDPGSVAVIGVSSSPTSFGARTLRSLRDFSGRKWIVHPRNTELQGVPCFPSIRDLPEVPDCVMLTVPRDAVEALVRECADAGVGGVIVGASGFAETGIAECLELQQRLVAIARDAGMRLVGPNCLGLVNYARRFVCTFATVPEQRSLQPGGIAIVSQSGALGGGLAQAADRGLGISHMLTSGNSADVDIADFINYLVDDPACSAIACSVEGLAHPTRLIAAGERAAKAGKPLIVNKLATGEQGAMAALSHTGSLAGSAAAYRAAFERAGVIVVDNHEALVETAAFFAKAPAPSSDGVAVLATSGGAAIMAADKAECNGVPLPQPQAGTRQVLEAVIPEFGSARNPCDVTAQSFTDPQSLYNCAEALLRDPAFGALVVPHPYAYEFGVARLGVFNELALKVGKPVCCVWVTDSLEGPGSEVVERSPGVVMFRSMDRCFATLAAWQDWHRRIRTVGIVHERLSPAQAAETTARMLGSCGGTAVTEREAKQILQAYGIPVVGERLVHSPDAAAQAAAQLGFPVALKVESPDILHKTDAGVIALNVKSPEEAIESFQRVWANALKVTTSDRVNGVLVQPMVPAGLEIMVGGKVDPLFGPLVLVGLGGVLVELLKDVSVELAPVSRRTAAAMLQRLKGASLLKGFRGSDPVDVDRLTDLVVRASELVADQRSLISELDVNPVICCGQRMTAVDALMTRSAVRPAE